jgi:intein/homing endonuclease
MAYVLGFWFADGYMRIEASYRIAFDSADVEILHQIREALNSSHPIRKRKTDKSWHLEIYSKRLYEKLLELGGRKRKSKTICFPKIQKGLIRDFIRGYFDGDGSVFYVDYISTKNHKPRRELRSNFTSGSKTFLDVLMQTLHEEIGLPKKQLGIYNQGSSLKLGYGTYDTHKLLRFMYYPNCKLGMKRKSSFAQTLPAISLPQWRNQHTFKTP